MNYYEKYLKYKNKYVNLKNLTKSLSMKASNNMKGGGMEVFCTLCGGPIHSEKIITNIELLKKYLNKEDIYKNLDILHKIKYELAMFSSNFELEKKKKKEKNILTLEDAKELLKSLKIPKEHNWLTKALILTENGIIKNVEDAYPTIHANGKRYYFEKPKNKSDLDFLDGWGYLFHNDCYKLLQNTYGNFSINDIKDDLVDVLLNKYPANDHISIYQEQEFRTNLAYFEDPYLLESPLINKKNRERILKFKIFKIKNESKNNYKKILKKKDRPSPSESATLFDIGTKKIGNDGNEWIIKENKNGVKKWNKV
jgi:hypothetical protein